MIKSKDRNVFDDCFYVLIKRRTLKLKLAILYSNLVRKAESCSSANLSDGKIFGAHPVNVISLLLREIEAEAT